MLPLILPSALLLLLLLLLMLLPSYQLSCALALALALALHDAEDRLELDEERHILLGHLTSEECTHNSHDAAISQRHEGTKNSAIYMSICSIHMLICNI